MAWISTLLCISAPYTLITMTFRAACSFSFSTHSLWSGKSKSPTRWWATRSRRAFHMVNSFRWVRHCPAIIKHLLYGMEKNALSLRGAERAIEGRPGLLSAARALTVTQAGGWWAGDLHTTLARRLRRMGGGKQKRAGNETRVR